MKVGVLFRNDDAVSPVIGIILMVAITVILAAVTGGFVLTVGDQQQTTPQATFELEKQFDGSAGNPDEVTLTHTGGDSIDSDNLYLSFDSSQIQESSAPGTPGPADRLAWSDLDSSVDAVSAGDSVRFEPEDSDPNIEDHTLRVIWEDGDASATTAVVPGREA